MYGSKVQAQGKANVGHFWELDQTFVGIPSQQIWTCLELVGKLHKLIFDHHFPMKTLPSQSILSLYPAQITRQELDLQSLRAAIRLPQDREGVGVDASNWSLNQMFTDKDSHSTAMSLNWSLNQQLVTEVGFFFSQGAKE